MSDIISSKKKKLFTNLTEVPMFACWIVSTFRERLGHKETSGVNCQPHKMVKHTQFVGNFPLNCLRVFDHFVGLALEGL